MGLDDNWFGNQLSQANLYGFGRLAWNPDLSARQIAEEWTRLTFGSDPKVDRDHRRTCNSARGAPTRTTPGRSGLQTLTDITGNHYGVNVEASERNGWGQWHRADEKGVGMDRTVATGTGYIGQYRPAVASVYESLATCPDDLLLFLHHVPYTYKLHSGKTVIQYIYDSHYEGADAVAGYVAPVEIAEGPGRRAALPTRCWRNWNIRPARRWCGATRSTTGFSALSGIPDAKGRVGHYPGPLRSGGHDARGLHRRATSRPRKTLPAERPSPAPPAAHCTASLKFTGEPGWYTLRVEYFDQANGVSHYRVWVGKQLVDEWAADLRLPTDPAGLHLLDAPHDLRHRSAPRRRDPHRRPARRRGTRRAGLPGDREVTGHRVTGIVLTQNEMRRAAPRTPAGACLVRR